MRKEWRRIGMCPNRVQELQSAKDALLRFRTGHVVGVVEGGKKAATAQVWGQTDTAQREDE